MQINIFCTYTCLLNMCTHAASHVSQAQLSKNLNIQAAAVFCALFFL